jgi:hypothetical protein
MGLILLAACSPDGQRAEPSISQPAATAPTPASAPVDSVASTVLSDDALAAEMDPLVPDGWEVQRAYRQPATVLGSDVDLVAVYLRPTGDDPSPEQYLEQAVVALQSVASGVLESDRTVTAIDVCLQRPNDAAPTVQVDPAIQMLGFREDLEPLLARGVQLPDFAALAYEGKSVLFADDYVTQASGWSDVIASAGTTPP